jgi:hypothetical protein
LRFIVLISVLSAPVVSEAHPAGKGTTAEACAAAEAIVATYQSRANAGEKLVFSVDRPFPISGWGPARLADLARGWRDASPAKATLARWGETRPASALDCPNAATLASRIGEVLPKGAAATLRERPRSAGPVRFYTITLPVLDKSRTEGVARISDERGVMGGAEDLILVRKHHGQWRVSGTRHLSIG